MHMDARIARIIDANLNRAREALRVMEEYARFVLDDPGGCAAVKRLRHSLAEAVAGLNSRELLLGRDTANDVGTKIVTPTESTRAAALSCCTRSSRALLA